MQYLKREGIVGEQCADEQVFEASYNTSQWSINVLRVILMDRHSSAGRRVNTLFSLRNILIFGFLLIWCECFNLSPNYLKVQLYVC